MLTNFIYPLCMFVQMSWLLNPSKTKFLILGTKQHMHLFPWITFIYRCQFVALYLIAVFSDNASLLNFKYLT